jgi:hypothetical protein
MEGGHPAQVERGGIERDSLSLGEGKEILPEFRNGFAGFFCRSGEHHPDHSQDLACAGRKEDLEDEGGARIAGPDHGGLAEGGFDEFVTGDGGIHDNLI